MHPNLLLSEHSSAQIDIRVEKILNDLGDPHPPLNLEDVRRLLKLDLGYYSTADTTWLNEKIHQLKVAGKQVLSSPTSNPTSHQATGIERRSIDDVEEFCPTPTGQDQSFAGTKQMESRTMCCHGMMALPAVAPKCLTTGVEFGAGMPGHRWGARIRSGRVIEGLSQLVSVYGRDERPLRRCPFLALCMPQAAANGSKARH